jgi:rhamnose utilization protein RhaD (predicted bifunctional aldolase and dehydrogenase)
VPVDLPAIQIAIQEHHPRADQPAQFCLSGTLRPSIETSLHAVFAQRVVVHVHCVNTLSIVIRPDAPAILTEKLTGFNWAFVPNVKPGARLAALVSNVLQPNTDVVLLGNHGLIVAADTVDAANTLLTSILAALDAPIRTLLNPDRQALAVRATPDFIALRADHPTHQVALYPDLTAAAEAGSLYPDHVIFLGVAATVLETKETPEEAVVRRSRLGLTPPILLLVPGAGALIRSDATSSALALAKCLGDVLLRLPEGAPVQILTAEQNEELLDWDAEKYRQALNVS